MSESKILSSLLLLALFSLKQYINRNYFLVFLSSFLIFSIISGAAALLIEKIVSLITTLQFIFCLNKKDFNQNLDTKFFSSSYLSIEYETMLMTKVKLSKYSPIDSLYLP